MKGLTLVEVLVAMGVATIVGTLLVVIIVNSTGLFLKQSARIEQGLGVNEALSNIRNAVREAQNIAATYPETPPPSYTSGSSQLILKLASVDNADNIIANSFDYFVFFLDQSVLRLKTYPAEVSSRKSQDRIFLTNADRIEFKYFDSSNPPQEVAPVLASKVKITLSLKQKSGTEFEVTIATSEANLRND